MRCDGRDNTKKLRGFISIVVPSKNKNENKKKKNKKNNYILFSNIFYILETCDQSNSSRQLASQLGKLYYLQYSQACGVVWHKKETKKGYHLRLGIRQSGKTHSQLGQLAYLYSFLLCTLFYVMMKTQLKNLKFCNFI